MATTLEAQLAEIHKGLDHAPPGAKEAILSAKQHAVDTFDASKAIQPGDKLPSFTLPDATGKQVSSAELLKQGPLLITFYRGEWCPYCNLSLRSFQKRLAEVQAKSVTLVAISPELPDTSLTTIEKNELAFPVLSDVGLSFAKKLGLTWKQPDTLRPIFEGFGTDLKKRNGDDSFELPVPSTLLVGKDGVVKNIHTDADWSRRLEPQVVVDWINAL